MLWILLVVGLCASVICLIGVVTFLFMVEIDDVIDWLIRLAISVVVGLIGLFGLAGIGAFTEDEVSQTGNWELVSITDNSQISGEAHGSIFYVRASLDTDEVYTFYYALEDGGIKKGKVDVKTATLYEKDDCTPHVVEYTTYTKNKMPDVLRAILAFGYGEKTEKAYEIYAPTGTVLRAFNLDMQ